MKKLFSLIAAVAVVFTLAACEPDTVTETVIEYRDKIVYEDKIVKEIEVVYETITEYVTETVTEYVSADVENERFYKPGVYFNNTAVDANGAYTYTVVVVDAYGQIAGIMFDDTKTTSEFLTDGESLYVYVAGDGKSVPNTYRLIDNSVAPGAYPSAADAITADDLVVGIHQAAIAELSEIAAFETSQILGAGWVSKTDALIERIIADQSTYGITTSSAGEGVVAVNVATDLDNVDVLMGLVQDILDGDAALTEEVELATTPVHGLYTPGAEFATNGREVGSSVYYYTSFVVVDEYGRIAGVFNDATSSDKVVEGATATKQIMKEAYGMGTITGNMAWYLQANGFGAAVVKNQGTAAITASLDTPEEGGHSYTDLIAGTTIGVEGLLGATNNALADLEFDYSTLADGTYYIAGAGEAKHTFMYVTIEGDAIESVYLDNTQGTEQATVLVDGEWLPVSTFEAFVDADNSVTVLVYFDGDDYITMEAYVNADDSYAVGDRVEFYLDETDGADELATLEIVPGYMTKQMLGDRYEMASGNSWAPQADAIAAAFVAGPYSVNLTEDGHTTLTGVTVGHIGDYQQMLIDLLLAVDDNSLYANADFTVDSAVVDGTYFASLPVDELGEQMFAWMSVDGGDVESIVFDKTTVVDGLITTVNSIYDADADASDHKAFTEASYTAATVDYNVLIGEVAAAYDYENDEFDTDMVTAGIQPVVTANEYQELVVLLAEQAVRANLQATVDSIFAAIDADAEAAIVIPSAGFVVGDETVITDNLITTALNGSAFDVLFTSTNEEIVGLEARDTNISFEAEANGTVDLTVTLELGDYVSEAHAFTLTFVTEKTQMEADMAADVTWPFTTIIDGFDLTLPTITSVAGPAKWMVKDGAVQGASYQGALVDGEDTTVTLVAWFDTDTTSGVEEGFNFIDSTEVSREFTINVLELAGAKQAVLDSAKPGNILDQVTAGTVAGLSYNDTIGGLTGTWAVISGPVVETTDDEVLTITRDQSDTEEASLEFTLNTGETKEFKFYVVQADAATITARVKALVDAMTLTSPAFYADVNKTFTTTPNFGADTVAVEYEVVSDNAVLSVDAQTPQIDITAAGTVEVKATFTAGSSEGVESVEYVKVFTFEAVDAANIG